MAALNAALNASLPAEASSNHPELADAGPAAGEGSGGSGKDTSSDGSQAAAAASDNGDSKVDMRDAIAQLKQSLEVDVAMLTSWTNQGQPAGSSSSQQMESAAPGDLSASAAALDAEASLTEAATDIGTEACEQPVNQSESPAVPLAPEPLDDNNSSSSIAAASFTNPVPLPKGWGPRLGVGFSQVRNNIVCMKQLAGRVVPACEGAAAVTAHHTAAEQS